MSHFERIQQAMMFFRHGTHESVAASLARDTSTVSRNKDEVSRRRVLPIGRPMTGLPTALVKSQRKPTSGVSLPANETGHTVRHHPFVIGADVRRTAP